MFLTDWLLILQPLGSNNFQLGLSQLVEFVGQSSVMCSQGLEHLPDWLEGRLREDVVGVFGLVDEDRNHDRADLLAGGFADHSADRLDDVHHRPLGVNERHAVEHRNIDPFAQAGAVAEDAARVLRQVG